MNMIPRGMTILATAIILAGGITATIGCTPEKELKKDPFFEKWRARAQEARAYSPSAARDEGAAASADAGVAMPETTDGPDHEDGAVSDVAETVKEKSLPTTIIGSLKINNVAVDTLLRLLARAADQDILISEHVKGNTTISVTDMPWDRVFQGILNNHGLSYVWEGDMLRIVTLEDIDREIKLMEARQKKKAKKKEFRLTMNSLETRERMVEPLKTWVYHVRYADTNTLRENLDKFFRTGRVGTDWTVSGKDRGKVSGKVRGAILVDPHTNSLVIQAVQSDIDRLKETVQLLDVPTRQVLIEAYIVQATDNAARALGIQWGGQYKFTSGSTNNYVTSGANSTGGTGGDLNTAITPTTGNVVNFPVDTALQGFTLGYIAENLGQHLLSVQLSALETDGKLNILSSPSITTLDNQKALIESGREIPYQTTDDGNVKIEYKKAALSLEVTPYVVDQRTLKLNIKTQKDEPDFANTVGGQPTIITRKAETRVVLFDGQTTVIGGLSERKGTDSESGVPMLKDMPLFGRLFKSNASEDDLDELLIFITPHILKESPETARGGDAPAKGGP